MACRESYIITCADVRQLVRNSTDNCVKDAPVAGGIESNQGIRRTRRPMALTICRSRTLIVIALREK